MSAGHCDAAALGSTVPLHQKSGITFMHDTHLCTLLRNNAAIGGLKVATENGWFAARPSGPEDIYKIYAESFKGESHLKQIQEEAQKIVAGALGA